MIYKRLWPDQIDLFNQQKSPKLLWKRDLVIESFNRGVRKEKIHWGETTNLHTSWRCILFYSWNVSETSVHGLWSYFDLRYRSTSCVELYHLMDSTYTVWQLVQCDTSLYILTIHCNVIWKSYISFNVICLPSYRPYNLLEKKTLELLCMLCNLCYVSVKKVEKWVSWLLVSVEMAPSEIVLEDNFFVWHSKNIWFPGHDNLRSRAKPNPSPFLRSPPSQLHHHQYQHSDTSMQTHTHIIMRTCWPVLLRRREMLSNSAFQHSTSDYLFSFTGRFELVMYFPFSVGLASLFLVLSCTHWEFLVPQCVWSTWTET